MRKFIGVNVGCVEGGEVELYAVELNTYGVRICSILNKRNTDPNGKPEVRGKDASKDYSEGEERT
jgi:hypothetical protein